MNKTELIAAVAEKTGMTKKDAERAVAATLESISFSPYKAELLLLPSFSWLRAKESTGQKLFFYVFDL